jgi:transcriptional antiterminator RfaH
MDSWYVIQTKPKKEGEASSYLALKGLEIFNPLLETFFERNGRMNQTLKPLFPTYIFGKFDLMEKYTLVKWAKGVKKIIGNGEGPIPIAENVINEIKNRSDGKGIVNLKRQFAPNEPIRIKFGPFKNFLGIFEGWVPEKERVCILLNLIGFQPRIDLPFSMIEKMN